MHAFAHRSPTRRARGLWTSLAAAALLSLPAGAQDSGVVLYAAAADGGFGSGPSNSTLYTIDPETGIATEVGPIGFDNVTGLVSFRGDPLLATARDDFEGENGPVKRAILISIDRATGQGTFIGSVDDNDGPRPVGGVPNPRSFEKCGRISDLTVDLRSSTLFGMGAACRSCRGLSNPNLNLSCRPPDTTVDTAVYVIDVGTGRGAGRTRFIDAGRRDRPIPAFTQYIGDGNAITYDPFTDSYYFASSEKFILLDVTFSCVLPEPEDRANLDPVRCPQLNRFNGHPLLGTINAMDVHPLSGVLYASQKRFDGSFLVTIETSDCLQFPHPLCGEVKTVGQIRDAAGNPIDGFDALAFRGPQGCPAGPLGPCRQSGLKGGKLKLSTKSGKEVWSWTGAGTEKSALGDPTADTEYRICITDFSDITIPRLVNWQLIPPGESWRLTKSGFKYKSKDGAPDGITKIKIQADIVPKKAVIKIKGKDALLPELPLQQNTRMAIQLINDLGECWDSEFLFPAAKNDEKGFKDKQ